MMQQINNISVPKYDPNEPALYDTKRIMKMLPHRYPFQMVDKIVFMDSKVVVGIKNVTINEQFFQGHFPSVPIMPGVLQIEALVQTGGILVLNTVPDPENYLTYFLSIDNCRFKRKIVPGDTLIMQCELLTDIKMGIAKMSGVIFVGNEIASYMTMSAQITKDKA